METKYNKSINLIHKCICTAWRIFKGSYYTSVHVTRNAKQRYRKRQQIKYLRMK